MKLRARLVLAFLLLAVIPLTGIVTYSYATSLRAFRRAVEAESRTQAEAMNQRLAAVRGALENGLGHASRVAVPTSAEDAGSPGLDRASLLAELRRAMGPAAPLVKAFEFIPASAAVPVDGVAPPPETPQPPAPAPVAVPHPTFFIANPLDAGARPGATGGGDPGAEGEGQKGDDGAIDFAGVPDSAAIQQIVDAAMAQAAAAQRDALKEMEREAPRHTETVRRWMEAAGKAAEAAAAQRERQADAEALKAEQEKAEELLGQRFSRTVERDGRVVGQLTVQVRAKELLQSVLAASRRDEGEVPFAVDSGGTLYTVKPADKAALAGLDLTGEGAGTSADGQWLVSRTRDATSGLTFGIARPVGGPLAEIRRTAARNLGLGLGLIGLAALGIVPVSRRMTRNLGTLTAAAEELAKGDLEVRVPVRSRDEIGALATSFNHMAGEIQRHQRQLLEEERQRREQEVAHRLLTAENERKSRELEEARRFQLALLPASLPDHPGVDIAVAMRTATEVGGDYYDFRIGGDGALTAAIGDATGHGATAGTMVTMIKSLFTMTPDLQPQTFLERAAGTIREMNLGRMCMALSLVRVHEGWMLLSAAGMPPLLLFRKASGAVEELTVEGMPLGAFAGATYRQVEVKLEPGDTALLMSDGFPELLDTAGEPLGYERARALFAEVAALEPDDIVARLQAAAERWCGGGAPNDDVTFVVLRARDTRVAGDDA